MTGQQPYTESGECLCPETLRLKIILTINLADLSKKDDKEKQTSPMGGGKILFLWVFLTKIGMSYEGQMSMRTLVINRAYQGDQALESL